ncbi:MAG TPA: Zn-binding domain-containing protein, partial [Chthonomonadaceae bacterium]|nr:Zn-binding domain-containing protein [Chthonomonadaceae bacterium]
HPEYFFGRPHERAVVDPDNRRILAQHLLCAAYERPLASEDLPRFGPNVATALETLVEEGKLFRQGGRWRYAAQDYPAANVNIRSASDTIFRIVNEAQEDRLIGTVEGGVAFKTLHPGAIYLHMGETYKVETLDIAGTTAFVRPAEADYYTEAQESSRILILDTRHTRELGKTTAAFGEVVVTNRVMGYRRKKLFSDDVLAIEDLDLPEQTFETEAFWFTVPQSIAATLIREGGDLAGSIHAIEHAAIGMMPLLATCDRWDLGGVSTADHPDTNLPTIFIYDGYPGGVGIAEAAYTTLRELLSATHALIAECPCAEGCPSCVQSPKCGNNNNPLDKQGARYLLELLLDLETRLPELPSRGGEEPPDFMV